MAHVVIFYIVMAYIVMASIVMAYIGMPYIVMATARACAQRECPFVPPVAAIVVITCGVVWRLSWFEIVRST